MPVGIGVVIDHLTLGPAPGYFALGLGFDQQGPIAFIPFGVTREQPRIREDRSVIGPDRKGERHKELCRHAPQVSSLNAKGPEHREKDGLEHRECTLVARDPIHGTKTNRGPEVAPTDDVFPDGSPEVFPSALDGFPGTSYLVPHYSHVLSSHIARTHPLLLGYRPPASGRCATILSHGQVGLLRVSPPWLFCRSLALDARLHRRSSVAPRRHDRAVDGLFVLLSK